jgi:predicted permease
MAVVHGVGMVLSDEGGFPVRYEATEVSANTFRLVGQRPILGRDFAPADETAGAAPVAILSYGFWERRYGKDAAIVGRTIRMNGAPTTVIGVMAQRFSFPQKQDLWVPLTPSAEVLKREARDLWFAFGRLAEGATVESARAEMETIAGRLASAHPLTNRDFVPVVQKFHEFFIGPNAASIYGSMWGAVGFVLLIACANLANLLLARAMGRRREISVRIALGAGRWRIIRQLLVESVMLSAAGGVFGFWIARWGVRAYELAMAQKSPWMVVDYAMDYRVVAYLMAISIGTGLLFGLAPASRLSQLDINAALKDGGRGSSGGWRGKPLPAMLVIGEMALAVVLLAGAGVMIRSFVKIYTADVGVDTANVLIGSLGLPTAKYPSGEAQISFFDGLTARLEAGPGVASVAIASRLPTWGTPQLAYELEGGGAVEEQRRPKVSAVVIDPSYFPTLGAAVLSGREFDDADGVSGIGAVIVNQRFAARSWPGEDAAGKRLRLFDGDTPGEWLTVVGVAPNIVQNDATRQQFDPLIYLPYRQAPAGTMWVFARTRVPPAGLGMAFRREVQALDPDLPIYGPFALAERLEVFWNSRFYGALFLIFAAVALLLASVGLYTVIAHAVGQRTQEIGVRMALGAQAGDIRRLVLRQGMVPLGIGLCIGLAASFVVNRVLEAELVEVSPADPLTLAFASAVLVFSAALGCWIPARRAMRVDPMVALRHE